MITGHLYYRYTKPAYMVLWRRVELRTLLCKSNVFPLNYQSMAVTTRLELALSSLTAKRINPFSYVTKFEFLLRFQTHSTLTQNQTEIVWVETICTIHYAIRVFRWRKWDSNPSDVLFAKQMSTPSRPHPQIKRTPKLSRVSCIKNLIFLFLF